MSALKEWALKEKKSLEEAYDEGFDVIFNYGYGRCAFAHNICGSQPVVPDGMPYTSKSLPLEFFINPRCPPSTVSGEAVAVLEVGISDVGEHLSTAEVRLGNEHDSSARATRESEEPDVSSGS